MKRELHTLIQGGQEWHAFRATHDGASEASSMLGISPYKTRQELMREKSTGITPEVSPQLQSIFDKGHATEIGGRAMAEAIIGEDLFPVTYSYGRLSASSDGLTMDGAIAFEHKQWSEELAKSIRSGILPDHHQPQCQQVMHVTGAEKLLFMCSDGTEQNCEWMWVYPDPACVVKLDLGWAQFSTDLENYQHVEVKPEATGRAPDALPALYVEVTGMVTASNLREFQETALAFIGKIKTELQTDDDFATADKTTKFLKDGEDRLELVKSQALAQTASIDELFRSIDHIREEMRVKRLQLEKLVKSRKESIRYEIMMEHQAKLTEHIGKLNKRLGDNYLSIAAADFNSAIKGKKTVQSCRDACDTELARAKIAANEVADRIELNRKCIDDQWLFLFPDFAQVCMKEPDDFARLYGARIQQENERATAKLETERARIRAEEEAKACAAAEAKVMAEQAAQIKTQLEQQLNERAVIAPIVQTVPEPDTGATIRLGEICDRLGFNLTAQFVSSLGFSPISHDKNAKLFRACDFRPICNALVKHINAVSELKEAA